MVDGSAVLLGDGWGGEDGLSAPVQQGLWDSGGLLPAEELPWGMASGCNMDQVASDGGRGGKFRGGAVASGIRGTDPRFLHGVALVASSSPTERRGLGTGLMVLGQSRAYGSMGQREAFLSISQGWPWYQ